MKTRKKNQIFIITLLKGSDFRLLLVNRGLADQKGESILYYIASVHHMNAYPFFVRTFNKNFLLRQFRLLFTTKYLHTAFLCKVWTLKPLWLTVQNCTKSTKTFCHDPEMLSCKKCEAFEAEINS